jgi:two-component system phosphate regulon sensor histidine kinase PhoR
MGVPSWPVGRLSFVYFLILAVLGAAVGLAFYGYSYSSELSTKERHVILDTMLELAEEKVIGIESEVIKADLALFDSVDIDNLLEFQRLLASERPAVESVLIIDEQLQIVPGGFFTRRGSKEEIDGFREFFETTVIADLRLPQALINKRGHLHRSYSGRPYLFSFTRLYGRGRTFYIVVEADLSYLVGTVFPQFFAVRSPRLYQVSNQHGELVYGFPFKGVRDADIVELSFAETVNNWRLRVAQKRGPTLAARSKRQVLDLVLIGSALMVIIAGLTVLLVAVRRERRANELKSDFISNVSHELKTPLSIISMFGELLAMGRTKSPEQATEYAEIIRRESVRLARLIDNVLDFAKIEKGVDVLEFDQGHLGEVVALAVELSHHRVSQAGMTVEVDCDDGIPPLQIDANSLTLALLNLLDNAIKYADEGKRIEVGLRLKQDRVELEVRDFGPGIPAKEHSLVFDRFYRAQAVRRKPIRGSGIGLALVKHIADAHGGGLELDSEEGQGATFRLWIPLPTGR